MDPFDLDSIISVIENLIPGGEGHPGGGNVIFMGPGFPGNDDEEPVCNSGCEEQSPRDDVLKKSPPANSHRRGYGDFGDVMRGNFMRREEPATNSQRDEVLKRPDFRNNVPVTRGPPQTFRDEFDELADIFLPDFFDPFSRGQRQHFFDDFGSLRGEDPFDPIGHFAGVHPGRPNHRKEDVDLDTHQDSQGFSPFFGSGHSHSSNLSFRSNGYYKKTSTWYDSQGNKQVETTTRDSNGVENKVVERHLPDGTIERIEESNRDDGVMATNPRNDVVVAPRSKPFDPYKYLQLMRKPLYDDKIFFPQSKAEEEETSARRNDRMKMEDYKLGDGGVQNFIPMTFKRLLKHFLHGD